MENTLRESRKAVLELGDNTIRCSVQVFEHLFKLQEKAKQAKTFEELILVECQILEVEDFISIVEDRLNGIMPEEKVTEPNPRKE